MTGLLGQPHVQGEEVRRGQQLVKRLHPFGRPRVRAGRDVGVVAADLHSQTRRSDLRHAAADAAQADDAQRPARQLDADELRTVGKAPVAQGDGGRDDVPGQGQHQADRVLGDRVGVRFRGEDHRDAARGGRVAVDVVHAHPVLGDHLQPGTLLQIRGADLEQPDDDCIRTMQHLPRFGVAGRGPVGPGRNAVARRLQQRHPARGDRLRYEYGRFHRLPVSFR